jgi:hypothetical protein
VCNHRNELEILYGNLFESLYRLDRDFALPITEEQYKILSNFKDQECFRNYDARTIEFLTKAILEIASLPVPTTIDEKWQFSMTVIKRMKKQHEVLEEMLSAYREAGQTIPVDYRNLLREFYNQFQGNLYEWICNSHEIFDGAVLPQGKVEILMEASTIQLNREEYSSLPQKLIWEPSTGQLSAHLEFFLSGEGKRLMDIDLRQHADDRPQIFANQYAGCYHYWNDDENHDELRRAEEEKLPLVAQMPEPAFVARNDAYPKGGMSLEVMLQMFDKLQEK